MVHKGNFIHGLRWEDDSGHNSILLCYDAHLAQYQREI
jgi:hypothetical protein